LRSTERSYAASGDAPGFRQAGSRGRRTVLLLPAVVVAAGSNEHRIAEGVDPVGTGFSRIVEPERKPDDKEKPDPAKTVEEKE
jgi:hypothetical protein